MAGYSWIRKWLDIAGYGWIWLDMAGYRTLTDEAIVGKKSQRAVFTPDGS